MKRQAFTAGLLLVFIAWTATATAQSVDHAVFIDGAVFGSSFWRSQTELADVTPPNVDLNGTVIGGGVAVGAWLTPRISARLELAFPADLSRASEISRSAPQGVIITSRSEASQRERTAAALLAYHTVRRHGIQLGYVAGVSFLFLTEQDTYSTTASPPMTYTYALPENFTRNSYGTTAEVGIDADIILGGRFSIVPQVRLVGDVSVRPGIALRIQW
jgi:hypothetical protein